jgi:hypothetical protein
MVHARCNDGSESPSIGIQGTCSHHGGVHREIEPSSPGTVDVLGPLIIFLIGAVVVAVGAVTHRLTGVKMEQKVPVLASGSPRSGRRWSDWAYGVAKFSIPALSVLFLSYAWFTAGVDKPAQTPVAVPSGASEPAQTPGAFACGASEPAQTPRGVVRGAAVSTCFTPRQPCEDSIVTKINEGRSEIRVQSLWLHLPAHTLCSGIRKGARSRRSRHSRQNQRPLWKKEPVFRRNIRSARWHPGVDR